MLKFVNIDNEIPAWQKDGVGVHTFGLEYATNKTPLDFQYVSGEAVSSFKIIEVDNSKRDITETDLNTSLISLQSGNHYCTGTVDYDTPLFPGIYYYLVNNKYKSDLFGIFKTDTIIYSSISVDDAVAGDTATLNFTATHSSDINSDHDVTFYFGFSCNIPGQSFEEIAFTTDTFAKTFDIPVSVFGECQVRISDSLGGSAVYNLAITQNTGIGFMIIESTFIVG